VSRLKADEPARATRLALCELTRHGSPSRPGSLGNSGAREDVVSAHSRAFPAIPVQGPRIFPKFVCREQAAPSHSHFDLPASIQPPIHLCPARSRVVLPPRARDRRLLCLSLFSSAAESLHGYDITDHNKLNDAIGSREEYDAWVAGTATRTGWGRCSILSPTTWESAKRTNIVVGDVLENGPSSAYAPYFDIDWQPLKADCATRC
jgi:hypothetical protein